MQDNIQVSVVSDKSKTIQVTQQKILRLLHERIVNHAQCRLSPVWQDTKVDIPDRATFHNSFIYLLPGRHI